MAGIVLICGLAAAGCHRASYAADDKTKVHVGIVFDVGGKDDRSFNAAAWQGVQHAAKDFPIIMRDAEPGDPTSIEPAIRAFAERNFDLIIAVGFNESPIIDTVAKDYPNLNFAIVDGFVQLPNVASLIFKEHEGSFLVGMIAALTSKTGAIGFVGGMDIPLIRRFEMGYEAGAKRIQPQITVFANYVGVTSEAWNNPPKGKELALSQYEAGADVVFAAAGASGLGVFDAAEDKKKFAIGVDANQDWMKPGLILTSMLKRVDLAVFTAIEDARAGKFSGGLKRFGLHDKGVDYSVDGYNAKVLTEPVRRRADELKAEIIAGKIIVPDYYKK